MLTVLKAFRLFERFWNSLTISNDFVGVIRRVTDIINTIEAYSPKFRTKVLNALVKRNLSFRIKVGIALPPSEDHGKKIRENLQTTESEKRTWAPERAGGGKYFSF